MKYKIVILLLVLLVLGLSTAYAGNEDRAGTAGALELTIGFIAVAMAAGNAVGGYVATVRMLEMFQHSPKKGAQ